MSRPSTILLSVSAIATAALCAAPALAQQGGGDSNGSGSGSGPVTVGTGNGQPTTIVVQPSTTTTTSTVPPPGYPAPGTDINAGLPSSSRPVNSTSQGDSFDLGQESSGGGTVYGGKNSSAIINGKSVTVPEIHTVRRGNTLWDLCGTYYNNPWNWPKVWSYNPQIQNPHWIYPGDQVRMRPPGSASRSTLASLHGLMGQGPNGAGGPGGGAGTSGVPSQTVFLRDKGYIDDPSKDTWGNIVGSREDQMLLSSGNHVYMQLKPGKKVAPGQLLTIYRPVRQPKNLEGARRPPGEIIAIKGTVKVDEWDPENRVARGVITESLDVIERGAKVGPVGRRFDVVQPKVNDKTVWARVLTSVYPHIYLGQNQVAFIDKGSEDGLAPGNRLFVVRRGDAWRRSLKTASDSARQRVRMDDPGTAPIERTPTAGNEKDFPEEVIGELRVLRTRRYSSICLVTVSHREIVPGDGAVARKGY